MRTQRFSAAALTAATTPHQPWARLLALTRLVAVAAGLLAAVPLPAAADSCQPLLNGNVNVLGGPGGPFLLVYTNAFANTNVLTVTTAVTGGTTATPSLVIDGGANPGLVFVPGIEPTLLQMQSYLNRVPGFANGYYVLGAAGGPFTLLAPTNDAFTALETQTGMTQDQLFADRSTLNNILLNHIIPGKYFFRQLTRGPTVDTALLGQSVKFDLTDGVFTVNGANISDPDNVASNGIMIAIDGVILPPDVAAAPSGPGLRRGEDPLPLVRPDPDLLRGPLD